MKSDKSEKGVREERKTTIEFQCNGEKRKNFDWPLLLLLLESTQWNEMTVVVYAREYPSMNETGDFFLCWKSRKCSNI